MPRENPSRRQPSPAKATDRQLAYAGALGIDVPEGASKATVSSLISIAKGHDKQARPGLLDAARSFGVAVHPAMGKREVFDAIHAHLSGAERDEDLARWFAFRVYRSLVKGADNAAIDNPADPRLNAIARELAAQPSVMKSIRRYESRDLVWFGTWTSPNGAMLQGGSSRTVAYKAAADMLRSLALAEERAVQLADAHRRWARVQEEEAAEDARANVPPSGANRGCLGVVMAIGVGTWLLARSLI